MRNIKTCKFFTMLLTLVLFVGIALVETKEVSAADPANVPIAVDTVRITGATTSFKPGDAPVFTAESAEPDLYYVYLEQWSEVGGNKYITSADFFNRDADLLIRQFEAGKDYTYTVWVKPAEIQDSNGDFLDYKTSLSSCRTLWIGDGMFQLTDEMVNDEEEAGIFLTPDWKMSVLEQKEYKIVSGADSEFVLDSGKDLVVTADGNIEDFMAVLVDDTPIARENITVESGSTVVTVKAVYLNTLSVGNHTIAIVYKNGRVETKFTVKKAAEADTPQPADTNKAISDQITAAEKGSTIKAEAAKDDKISKDVIAAAKEKGVGLEIKTAADASGVSIVWKFGSIANAVEFTPQVTVDASVAAITEALGKAADLPNTTKVTQVSFAHSGDLPGEAEVELPLAAEKFAEGSTAYLYYFDPVKKLFEKIDSAKCTGGKAVFRMKHCSDYIVTSAELPVELIVKPPKTGDIHTKIYVMFLLLGVMGVCTAVKKRSEI